MGHGQVLSGPGPAAGAQAPVFGPIGRVGGWAWPVKAEGTVATACRSALMHVVVAGPVLSVWLA
jgi:hypothetical protein